MRIMLDLNVLLDYFQRRIPYNTYSSIVLSEILKNRIDGLLPVHALTTIYYIIAKHADRKNANETID